MGAMSIADKAELRSIEASLHGIMDAIYRISGRTDRSLVESLLEHKDAPEVQAYWKLVEKRNALTGESDSPDAPPKAVARSFR